MSRLTVYRVEHPATGRGPFGSDCPEALRDARVALADQKARDAYAGTAMQNDYGQILVVCSQRDEALATLQAFMTGMSGATAPNEFRFDPIWSRLKDDPRFEEILKSAKPL